MDHRAQFNSMAINVTDQPSFRQLLMPDVRAQFETYCKLNQTCHDV